MTAPVYPALFLCLYFRQVSLLHGLRTAAAVLWIMRLATPAVSGRYGNISKNNCKTMLIFDFL